MNFNRRVAQLMKPYGRYKWLTILFNFLFAVFNLLSLALFIPTMKIIFRDEQSTAVLVKPASDGTIIGSIQNISKQLEYFTELTVRDNPMLALFYVCASVLIAFFLKNVSRYLAIYFQSYLRMAVVRDLREKMFEKVNRLPMSYHTTERKGDLLARMSVDVGEMEIATVNYLELFYREPIAILMTLAFLFYISYQLTLISFILLPITAFIISRIRKSLKKTVIHGQETTSDMFAIIEESLGGIRAIKSFVAEKMVEARFQKINFRQQQLSTRSFRKRDLASPLSEFLSVCVMIALVWFGGKLIVMGDEAGALTGAGFCTFIIVFSQLMRPVQSIANIVTFNKKAEISLQRIDEILNEPEVILNPTTETEIPSLEKALKLEDVIFKYDQEEVLKSINIEVKAGTSIALVGESGSGKSTIADLLPRFYDVSTGKITWDGIDIRDFNVLDLRKSIAVVSQESILFNDSVFYNIAFGFPNASIETVIDAAKKANAHDFILQLDNGYDTILGERGNRLSGGQKQRISIARAILKNAPVLILDEATSALDTENEKLVQTALEKLMVNKTSIIIAHRLSTIKNVDKIIVLGKGEILEEGKHQELMEKRGVYYKLSSLQGIEN
jgi:ATP-binding cassette, subfamily B, bacterial MsbA